LDGNGDCEFVDKLGVWALCLKVVFKKSTWKAITQKCLSSCYTTPAVGSFVEVIQWLLHMCNEVGITIAIHFKVVILMLALSKGMSPFGLPCPPHRVFCIVP
jgi:hypothetical protein